MKLLINDKVFESEIELSSGRNVEIKTLGNKIIIDAPALGKTRIKCSEFNLEGEQIEIHAGKGIKLSSIHPNIIVISSHYSELEAMYIDLQKRFDNLEKLFLNSIKKN